MNVELKDTPQYDGEGNLISAPQKTEAVTAAPGSVTEQVAKDLGAGSGEKKDDEGAMKTGTPLPFDLSKVTPEQLSQLKQMLNATPDRVARKKENPVIKLRVMNEKIVIDHKNAYTGIVRDRELRADVERPIIPVLLDGDTEWQTILYSDFMELPQIKCEVISQRKEENDVVDGSCVSNITGRQTEMLVHTVDYFYTVKLPGGATKEFMARIVNA